MTLDKLTVKTAQTFIDASREPANEKKEASKTQKLNQYASININNSGDQNG